MRIEDSIPKELADNEIYQHSPVTFEPKRNNRWLVRFPEQFDIPEWVCHSVSAPKFEEYEWNPITFMFYDPVSPSVSQQLIKFVNYVDVEAIGKDNPIFNVGLEFLDPTGIVVEKWDIEIHRILSVDFGGRLGYDNDGLKKCSLILKPKDCHLLL